MWFFWWDLGSFVPTNKHEACSPPLHLPVSFSTPSPLCFIYSLWSTWDWWSSPLIVVITAVLLLQCIMRDRLTKHWRGQGQIAVHWPPDACYGEPSQGPETMAESYLECLAPLLTIYMSRRRRGRHGATCCCSLGEKTDADEVPCFNALMRDHRHCHVSIWRWLLALLDIQKVSTVTLCRYTDLWCRINARLWEVILSLLCGVRVCCDLAQITKSWSGIPFFFPIKLGILVLDTLTLTNYIFTSNCLFAHPSETKLHYHLFSVLHCMCPCDECRSLNNGKLGSANCQSLLTNRHI